ncbi:hypothetical protein ACW2LR_000639 [Acinetobacter baumannii]|uniref:hypothetical protein n=1 Tax=Acinetobacter baumannii TaxID=470 RepID=UPI0021BD7F6D|nr:hypothetical protein [Acinetobacter baumannii]EKT8216720.1 hypothetical protein [Acinetobacter baumannii]EKT9546538.1 hypothetical protein [Acinetobacter baumannii]EKU0460400.1 hypothetical protein [Acinetobacter baumannii]EKU2073709.1 hypothetical protein [Acinetobacter baumannii]EKU2079392.1 hypothetical protein [Acinetobacter baumannii]
MENLRIFQPPKHVYMVNYSYKTSIPVPWTNNAMKCPIFLSENKLTRGVIDKLESKLLVELQEINKDVSELRITGFSYLGYMTEEEFENK